MSGGSYNYLYSHVNGLEAQRGDLADMSDRCASLGYDDAAADTLRVLALIGEAERQADRLEDVWHAVEWFDSNDWSLDQAKEKLDKYRAQRTPVAARPEDGAPPPPNLLGWRYVSPAGQVYVLTPETPSE